MLGRGHVKLRLHPLHLHANQHNADIYILYYIILYYIILYYVILCYIILYYIIYIQQQHDVSDESLARQSCDGMLPNKQHTDSCECKCCAQNACNDCYSATQNIG